MRVIHLCFQLHEPFGLRKFSKEEAEKGYFESKAEFVQADKEIYQPLFAFLERNTQKFRKFRFSLLVSGTWLDLAEQYDPELIRRLRDLVKLGQVELVAEPCYHSLAFFYDRIELEEQVSQYREKIQKLFGVEGRIFALPDLIYNDQVGKWAEKFGFAGMLVGGDPKVLGWHSPNHVYEAMECRYLRLLFRNTVLSRMVTEANEELLVEKQISKESEETKLVLSAQKFQKLLELDMLRGELVNLYLDASVFRVQREKGVIGFFDELVASWLEGRGNHFVGAAQACVVETPRLALSVKDSVSWRRDGDTKGKGQDEVITGIMIQSEAMVQPPSYLSNQKQIEWSKAVYAAKREILASEDKDAIEDWRRLTAVDYLLDADVAELREILADLKVRAAQTKKAQAVEISRVYTKKRDRGNVEARPIVDEPAVLVDSGDDPVVGVKVSMEDDALVEPEVMASVDEDESSDGEVMVHIQKAVPSDQKVEQKVDKKPRGVRKIIRKLVIE